MQTPIELPAEQTARWERGDGEPQRAYQAFLVFRDLGPTRNLHAVYRAWKEQKGSGRANPSGASGASGNRIAPPANWKRWRQEYRWVERAAAYDRSLQNEAQARFAEVQRRLMDEQLETLTADGDRIQILRRRAAEMEAEPMIKTVEEQPNGQVVTRDDVKEYQAVTKELHALEDRRYRLTEPLRAGLGGEREGEPATQRIAGFFTIGDKMYDGSDPPPLPGDALAPAVKEEDPLLVDLTGTPYEAAAKAGKKPASSVEAAEPEIDPAREELLKILKWRPK
jgi:hypothetical protein